MNKRPIGVFDSGLGGLTVVRELRKILPGENIIYFGDTGRVPYGSRSAETIRKYAKQDMDFLLSGNVKMIIAACGTVSSVAADIGESLPVPYTGVLKPASIAAINATKCGKIGVIGTTATVNSGSYKKTIQSIAPDMEVFSRDCPLFVPLVENGFTSEDDPIVALTVERYLAPFLDEKIDTLILGCTHYPILKSVISKFLGDSITLIDTGKETAHYAKSILEENSIVSDSKDVGKCSFFVSDRTEGFSAIAGVFLGTDITGEVTHVDIGTI